ncbi:MAG: D-Ala-D-Ala carboxypeptidase family metallohydrolase, partial [Planctomycetota bacterium]|nr:D-Ala-D-Ala carboxypeptidase family metallohydrolase [Planctomycetota bacterium]
PRWLPSALAIVGAVTACGAARGAADPMVSLRQPRADFRVICRWRDPVSEAEVNWSFAGDALVACSAGANIAVSAAIADGEAEFQRVAWQAEADGPEETLPARLPAKRLMLQAPAQAGAVFLRLYFAADSQMRQATLCVHVPYQAALSRPQSGTLTINGENLGTYHEPRQTGIEKVDGHPEAYQPPRLFLRITPRTADLLVSPSLALADLVVPSRDTQRRHTAYVPVCYPLLQAIEKLRITLADRGINSAGINLLSVFRTPAYNRSVGSGRFGRHIYGDAVDFIIDNDSDGDMDDLNRDGRVDRHDSLLLVAMIEDLQADGQIPIGGIGVYAFAGGPFRTTLHLDLRGHRATWGYYYSGGRRREFEWQSKRFAALDAAEKAERQRRGQAGAAGGE